jgi:hypothetical protein
MKLTIGMAHANDYDGVFFTVQALRLYQDLSDCEIIIIDNTPDTKHGEAVQHFVKSCNDKNIRYIPFNIKGTTQSRSEIFKQARGEAVLCMDCHVLLYPGAIAKLKEFYETAEDDMYTGPLIYDDLRHPSTHFNFQWRNNMWGTWGTAMQCQCGFKYCYSGDDKKFLDLNTPQKEIGPICQCGVLLDKNGEKYGNKPEHEPFVIPAQGLGLFTCKKSDWLGFNQHFRESGGEECYIHMKYHLAGRKTVCLPFLRWHHRFGRPEGVPYSNGVDSRIKNYIHGRLELGMPLDDVEEHFASRVKKDRFKKLVEECKMEIQNTPVESKPERQKVKKESMADVVAKTQTETWLAIKSNISGSRVADYSFTADTLFNLMYDERVEALRFWQYEPKQHEVFAAMELEWKDMRAVNISNMDNLVGIENIDVDTAIINFNCPASIAIIALEQNKNTPRIVVHSVTKGPDNLEMLAQWCSINNYGVANVLGDAGMILVLEKGLEAPVFRDIEKGAGTQLKKYLKKMGIEATENCKCNMRAKTMNLMGVEWCENNKEKIVGWLKEEAENRKMPFFKWPAKKFLEMAIRSAKKELVRSDSSV